MNINFFTSLKAFGDFKLEMTVADFLNAMENVAKETEDSLLAKVEKLSTPRFIPREEAMKMFEVTEVQKVIVWERLGFLTPYQVDGQIFYSLDEIIATLKIFCGKGVFFG